MNWIEKLYLGCAAAGGTVLVIQTLMLLFGGDSDAHSTEHVDMGHGTSGELHAHDAAFGLLSVRTGAAFLAFFGLVGWGGTSAGWGTLPTLGAAFLAGFVMLVAVGMLFRAQRKLFAQGNLDPHNAVGRTARVYLRIPASNAGKGKITVAIQGRTAEYDAFTAGAEIPTGAEVEVVRQVTADTFEVKAV
jgi:hypothetical protein